MAHGNCFTLARLVIPAICLSFGLMVDEAHSAIIDVSTTFEGNN